MGAQAAGGRRPNQRWGFHENRMAVIKLQQHRGGKEREKTYLSWWGEEPCSGTSRFAKLLEEAVPALKHSLQSLLVRRCVTI
ncbi:hypothetical protein chiPu_0000553 [Chiloscyllium punctatum]|uniref:Uncharacterized protein n=1 Tax=Chiloscyllium punctatum TaxID=137246 RepID=A0A401RVK3_CHIPU|nr:hypothetical protein [Chiloscyllium punctatum]